MAEELTPNDLAKRLRIAPTRFRRWLRELDPDTHQEVATHRHGERWRFTPAESEHLVQTYREQHGLMSATEISEQAGAVLPSGFSAGKVLLREGDHRYIEILKDGQTYCEFDFPQLRINVATRQVTWIDAITREELSNPFGEIEPNH